VDNALHESPFGDLLFIWALRFSIVHTGIIFEVSPPDRICLVRVVRDRNAAQKHVWRATCRRQPALAIFNEVRPFLINPLGNAFAAAQLGNAIFAAQAFQNDPDLLLRTILPARATTDVFYHRLRRQL
jgi:hypothetical protein